ncbi:Alpha/Beta hydrolase protein [Mycena maculata]|uniref:Alpha/Beta hydrolase protein n=1 Tax=Mycena maculata TaxID=230809 RepID=A0AAD7MK89_9AGAR|nr:Alpha/Beta hydrolase protein [Mycena maculata]
MYRLELFALTVLYLFSCSASASSTFDPRSFSKSTATCTATNRPLGKKETTVDIRLDYVDINPSAQTTLILVHGWPSLWSSWSNQIQEFKEDYHLIVPDLRGFGESTHPDEVRRSGTMPDLVGDLACILKHANISSAVCVGHDWGSGVCYEAGRSRPDLFPGVVGITVPYMPAEGDYTPVQDLLGVLPKLSYQIFLDKTVQAIAELDPDMRRTIRATLRTVASPPPDDFLASQTSYLAAWDNVTEIPPVPFFTSDEEDYFVEQYSSQGFKYTLQFYSADASPDRYASWAFAHAQGNYTIPQPVLAIFPNEDPVADWELLSKILKSADFLPNLRTDIMPGSHWCHLEYPETFNALLRNWLDQFFGAYAGHDEL